MDSNRSPEKIIEKYKQAKKSKKPKVDRQQPSSLKDLN